MTIFDMRGTEDQVELVRQAVSSCDFPFTRLLPSLHGEGKTQIVAEWADLSRYNQRVARAHEEEHSHVTEGEAEAHPIEREVDGRRRVLGLFYLPPHTRVVLDSSLVTHPELAREVFLAEAAHAVDYHYLSMEQRRQITNFLHRDDLPEGHSTEDGASFSLDGHVCSWFDVGPYHMWVGEAFMEAFTEAFAPSVQVTIALGHPTSSEVAAQIRELLVPRAFFVGRGKAYHDAHRGIAQDRWFSSREEAEQAGYRPCRVCKP